MGGVLLKDPEQPHPAEEPSWAHTLSQGPRRQPSARPTSSPARPPHTISPVRPIAVPSLLHTQHCLLQEASSHCPGQASSTSGLHVISVKIEKYSLKKFTKVIQGSGSLRPSQPRGKQGATTTKCHVLPWVGPQQREGIGSTAWISPTGAQSVSVH